MSEKLSRRDKEDVVYASMWQWLLLPGSETNAEQHPSYGKKYKLIKFDLFRKLIMKYLIEKKTLEYVCIFNVLVSVRGLRFVVVEQVRTGYT